MTYADLNFACAAPRGCSCVGAGLVTLDIVVDAEAPERCLYSSGGSCGNVMTILSYFGWRARPISRLGLDSAAQFVLRDMARFGVDTELVSQETSIHTPAIVERIWSTNGDTRTHSYSLRCPTCGRYLMTYRPITQAIAQRVLSGAPHPVEVFYFDRLSRGILNLARQYRQKGALVMFEPSQVKNDRLFKEATTITHILKYAQQRLDDTSGLLAEESSLMEIQTLGRHGLRYRLTRGASHASPWTNIDAFGLRNVVDEAGAGDWCSAGIIHSLAKERAALFSGASAIQLEEALVLGQALAAASCLFPGARGMMYSLSKEEVQEAVHRIVTGTGGVTKPRFPMVESTREFMSSICGGCAQPPHNTISRP